MEKLTASQEAKEYCLNKTENLNDSMQISKIELQKLIFFAFLKGVEREQKILMDKKMRKLNKQFLKDEKQYNK